MANFLTANEYLDYLSAGNSRCVHFEEDYLKCANRVGLQNSAQKCQPFFEDYKECMFGAKKKLRLQAIEAERKKQGRPSIPRLQYDAQKDYTYFNTEKS